MSALDGGVGAPASADAAAALARPRATPAIVAGSLLFTAILWIAIAVF